jgi:acyl-CoA thioesterase FadM
VLCSGEVKVACVRRSNQKPASMPSQLLEQLQF